MDRGQQARAQSQPGEDGGGTHRAPLLERIAGRSTRDLRVAGEECRSGPVQRNCVAQPTQHPGRGHGALAQALLPADQENSPFEPF
jgi:hypothetical protein